MTIGEENNKKIQHMRSQFLYSNIDIDYTTMVNIYIELGDMALRLSMYNTTNMEDISNKYIIDIFKKYLGDIDSDIILRVLKDYQNKTCSS